MPEIRVEAVDDKPGGVTTIHVGLVLAEAICLSAFVFELSRALSGNTLSWAYVFEWPVLGAYGVYMWHKLLVDARGESRTTPSAPEHDPQLDAWNHYLEEVHRNDRDQGRVVDAVRKNEKGEP